MVLKEIAISKLNEAKYNPRKITDKKYKGLKQSLKKFGFVQPVVVNKDMTIIGGHMRVKAWKELGHDTVPCNILDLNKKEEKKLNIVLNSDKISGEYDDIKLAEILEELKLDNDYLDLNLNQLEPLDLSQDIDIMSEKETLNIDYISCPDCGRKIPTV